MVDTASKTGFISQIIGPVLDIEFPSGDIPKIYNGYDIFIIRFTGAIFGVSSHRGYYASNSRILPSLSICLAGFCRF
jgi:F0F1-type ATP synthase beta subunit